MTDKAELALREPAPVYLPAPSEFQMMREMAAAICKTEFVPAGVRNRPEAALAALMYGREMGIGPMQALSRIHIIEGHPTLAAELMLGMIRRAGHQIVSSTVTREGASITARRGDTGEEMTVEFTVEEARQIPTKIDQKWATLADKSNWKSYPGDMCWARAVSRLGRRLFSDALYGAVYTPEDFGHRADDLAASGGYITSGDVTEAGVLAGLSGFIPRQTEPSEWGKVVKRETATFVRQRFYPDRGWSELSEDEQALVVAQAKELLGKAITETGAPPLAEEWLLSEQEAVAIFSFLRDGTVPDRPPEEVADDAEVVDAEVVEPEQVGNAVDEAIREQTWTEVIALCSFNFEKATAAEVEARCRKIYRHLGTLGIWSADELHQDLAAHLGKNPMGVHWSDLGVKARQVEFALAAQKKARRAVAEADSE